MSAVPLGLGLLRDLLPRERRDPAMALLSSSMGIGGSLALPAAALVAQVADWHVLFYGSAGLGALCVVLTLLAVLLLLPISKGGDWGWTSGVTLGLFAAAATVLVLWAVMELRLPAPLVNLRISARPAALFTNLASIMVGMAFLVVSLVLPQLLQLPTSTGHGLGQSMVVAGLCMAPLGLAMMLTTPVHARLSRTPKAALILGMLIIASGYVAGLGLMSAAWQSLVVTAILGVGTGLAYSSLPALIASATPAAETGAANALNTLMRMIGSSIGSAVIGTVLAGTAYQLGGVTVPSLAGFRASFLIAAGAMALGVLTALFLPREPHRHSRPRHPSGVGPSLPQVGGRRA